MAAESRVDQLLDEWEELRESNPRISLEQFIEDRLDRADNELIEAFRHQAEELAAIDRQMEQIAGPPLTVDPTPKFDDGDLRLSALQPGLEPIPGYTLVSRLGGGGFGEVWKAESPGGFHVALKFVPIGGRVGEIEERSLEVIKDVRHPHLLSVFSTWRIGDLLIIATELADRTLLDRFHEAQKEGHEGIPRDELLVYMSEAAKGIDFLNDPGKSGRMRIQHRDIKPQNLLLSGGSVKVGDFGLARSIQYDVTGHTGSLTFAYAAPECFDGTTSNRSDQYSLAITYCHLRSGRLPFDGTQVEIMEGHRKKEPELSMIPVEERPSVAKALAKRPKDRWESCSEFVRRTDMRETVTPPPLIKVWPKDSLYRTWILGAAVIIPLLIFIVWFSQGDDADQPIPGGSTRVQAEPESENSETAEKAGRPRIAVLYFENQSTERKELNPLTKGLCSMMITQLDAKEKYDVLERGRLEEVLNELNLSRSTMFDQRQAAKIGHLIGARQLVLGSYFHLLDVFRIDARLVDVETGLTLATAGVEGRPDDFSNLLSELVDRLAQNHAQRSDPRSQKVSRRHVPGTNSIPHVSVDSVSELGVAVDAYDRGDMAAAITQIDAVIQSNPSFEDAKCLRKQWTAKLSASEGGSPNEE